MSKRSIPSSGLFAAYDCDLEQLNNEEFWDYARRLAHAPPLSPTPGEEFLECEIEQGRCMLPLSALQAIEQVPEYFTPLPGSPPWMHGITSWHDEVLAVVDLAAYFSQTRAQGRTHALLLVAQHKGFFLGLLAHVLSSIPSLYIQQIQPARTASIHPPFARTDGIIGAYEGAFVLDIRLLLAATIENIQVTTIYE